MPTAQFRLSIEKWRHNAPEEQMAIARQSIQELAYRIVQATPVDIGFLRGSWQPSLNEPAEGPKGKGGHALKDAQKIIDPDGTIVGAKIAATILKMKPGDKFYMTNNAAYAMRMEFGFNGEDSLGRTYRQPGRYFVTGTAAQWPSIVQETADALAISPGAPPSAPAPAAPTGPPPAPKAPPVTRMTQYGPRKAA